MPKRNYNDFSADNLADAFNGDKGLIAGLLDFNSEELTKLLGHVANLANIPTATFKKARTELPSFSTAKWSEFAPKFGLPANIDHVKLDTFTTPKYRLPPSLHELMFENAWRCQDVYREKVSQTREEATSKILEPVC